MLDYRKHHVGFSDSSDTINFMSKTMCPHCNHEITEVELKKLWAQYCGSKRSVLKASTAIENGRSKGGRPMTYMQTVYESIPDGVSQLHEKLHRWNEKHIYDVARRETGDPATEGFDLQCDNIVWHCAYNTLSDYIEVTSNGQKETAIWRVNYSAKVAAKKLVEDIHRAKLMSMPEDHTEMIEWIKERDPSFDPKQVLPE
jgi:hypothetical protein